MTDALKLGFGNFAAPAKAGPSGVLVVFCDDGLELGPATRKALGSAVDLVARAAKAERFTGKKNTALALVVPAGLKVGRLVVIGVGKPGELKPKDVLKLGGLALGKLPNAASDATIFAELPGGAMKSDQVADLAQGVRLRAYSFDRYKTKRKDEEKPPATRSVTIGTADVAAARRAYDPRAAISDGVLLARDLVNEPSQCSYPEEFARRATALKKLRVLGRSARHQGHEEARHECAARRRAGFCAGEQGRGDALERRQGGRCTGRLHWQRRVLRHRRISIKPAAGMEDMKGDMAGAACVVGLMHALAARKARVNAVGVIGVVENMPDGNAQRPGDIVKSMSGQTIEIINTDAEGRLVLADVIWYTAQRFKPKFMVDLATLTGAIIVALGQEYAGMFCNNDQLSERLTKAGTETGELVWRMPLAPEYDKMIDSKFADMKNTGGSRWGGAITAAQFIKRFVDDKTPWAHLDIAGTGLTRVRPISTRAGARAGAFACSTGWWRTTTKSSDEFGDRCSLMTEILFYHLQRQKLENVLPALLKCLERGWKVAVQGSSEERIDALDAHLWTYRDDGFCRMALGVSLGRATAGAAHRHRQQHQCRNDPVPDRRCAQCPPICRTISVLCCCSMARMKMRWLRPASTGLRSRERVSRRPTGRRTSRGAGQGMKTALE